jgi:hypothetical protein
MFMKRGKQREGGFEYLSLLFVSVITSVITFSEQRDKNQEEQRLPSSAFVPQGDSCQGPSLPEGFLSVFTLTQVSHALLENSTVTTLRDSMHKHIAQEEDARNAKGNLGQVNFSGFCFQKE